jgi:hypothetical protein
LQKLPKISTKVFQKQQILTQKPRKTLHKKHPQTIAKLDAAGKAHFRAHTRKWLLAVKIQI